MNSIEWQLGNIASAIELNAAAIVVHAESNFRGQKEIASALRENAQALNTLGVIVARALNQDYESAVREAARVKALIAHETTLRKARILAEQIQRNNTFRSY